MLKEGMLRRCDWLVRLEFLGKHDPTSFINTCSGTYGVIFENIYSESFYHTHAVRINEENEGICDETDEDLGKLVT